MPQITDLPSGPMSHILMHLNAKERALFTQSCKATKHFPAEADSATTVAYASDVTKVIAIAEEHLKNIESQIRQPGQWMLDKQVVFARTNLEALKTHLAELENQTANGTPVRNLMLKEHQERMEEIASLLLLQINGMNPQTSCLQDLQMQEFAFLRSSIKHTAMGCQVMPSLPNRLCGFAQCEQFMQDGRVDDAIESAFAMESAKEQKAVLGYICRELVRLDLLPKILEVMDRMGDRLSSCQIYPSTWSAVYKAYSKEEIPEKRLERATFLVQLLRKGDQMDSKDAVDWSLEDFFETGTVEDMDGLIAILKKIAQPPGLDKDTTAFLTKVLRKCMWGLYHRHEHMRFLQILSIMPDFKEKALSFFTYFDEKLHLPLLQDKCFNDEFRSQAMIQLIHKDLSRNDAAGAERRLAFIQHPQLLLSAHDIIAQFYRSRGNLSKMEEHVHSIFDEFSQLLCFSEMSQLALELTRFEEAVLYASMLSENPKQKPPVKVPTRSAALNDLVEHLDISEWFERIVPLILSMRDQKLRTEALSKAVRGLYRTNQPDAIVDRIMNLPDSTMRDVLFEALILSEYGIPEQGLAEFLRGVAQLITDVNMRNNMLALIRHTVDEQKADT